MNDANNLVMTWKHESIQKKSNLKGYTYEQLDEEENYYNKIGLDINRLNCLMEMKRRLEEKKVSITKEEQNKLWRVWFEIALIYRNRGDLEKAMIYFEMSLELNEKVNGVGYYETA